MEFQNILGEKSRVAVAKKACRGGEKGVLRGACPTCVIARLMLYAVIARAVRLVAISLYVILSATKDLKACTAVHRHGDLEILHFVQNDTLLRHCESR